MKIKRLNESNINEPQIGDYVICSDMTDDEKIEEFVNNTIGQIVRFRDPHDSFGASYQFVVKYDDVPYDLNEDEFRYDNELYEKGISNRAMSIGEIEFFSNDKKEVEAYMQAKKYNL